MSDSHGETIEASGMKHPYHLVDPSPWPILGAAAAGLLAFGAIEFMHYETAIFLVLGFIAASIIFSLMINAMGSAGNAVVDHGVLRGFSRPLREWFFILAFASIGLSSNFREMAHHFKGGKPAILYVCGQSLNLLLTLTMAYVMFFLVFPEITAGLMN